MNKSIDIDDEVFEALEQHAQPFVDTTPNKVLRRLLGIGEFEESSIAVSDAGQDGVRAAPGTLLPEREYEIPILRYLDDHGGRAPSREVVEGVGEALADKLTNADRQPLK